MRYRSGGGSDAGVFFGASVMLYVAWTGAIVAGYWLGALIADPRRYGIDLVMPIFFAAMLVPLWRGGRRAFAWGVAGAVALATEHLVSGWWFVVTGAIAGSVAEGFADE
jgi:predicted branched-subunit amino acid permease